MTTDEPAGIRILGSLRAVDGNGAVRMEDRIDTDIDNVWSAITDPVRLDRWLGTVEGDLRQGGEHVIEVTLARDGDGGGDQTIVVWEERGVPLDYLVGYGAGVQIHVAEQNAS
jgi:Activator of Hsp90 ATPase homolog 1-like protein